MMAVLSDLETKNNNCSLISSVSHQAVDMSIRSTQVTRWRIDIELKRKNMSSLSDDTDAGNLYNETGPSLHPLYS